MTFPQYCTRLLVFSAAAAVLGCATGPQTYWVNPRLAPEQQRQQFTLDAAECAALADRYIPEPQQRQTTNITLNTPQGPVYGTATTGPGGFEPTGALAGQLWAERRNARLEYAGACLGSRGWERRYVPTVDRAAVSDRAVVSDRANVSADVSMSCQTSSDCSRGQSCRSKKGGGTECR